VRLNYWNVTTQEVRFTNAPVDLSIEVDVGNGLETWTGSGLVVNVSAVSEGSDLDVSGVDITFDGVNQTVIAIIMNNHFRHQPIEVYKAWYDPDAGTIEGTPVLYFKGYQMDAYSIGETSTDNPDAVSVSTRGTNLLTRTTAENTVMTNPQSHLNMLNRGGVMDTTANFFIHIPTILDLDVYWGEEKVNNRSNSPYDPRNWPGWDEAWENNRAK
jgi:hypothetical protein